MTTQKTDLTRALQVAEIIFEQLGQRARVMMGATNFGAGEFKSLGDVKPGLSFKIKGSKVKFIRILLNCMDLYDIEFLDRNGDLIKMSNSNYADMIKKEIERVTGLSLSL